MMQPHVTNTDLFVAGLLLLSALNGAILFLGAVAYAIVWWLRHRKPHQWRAAPGDPGFICQRCGAYDPAWHYAYGKRGCPGMRPSDALSGKP